MGDISGLRWVAIIIGVVMIIGGFWWGRRRTYGGTSPAILFLAGLGLGLAGLFPAITRVPTELVSLEHMRGGALITLLIFSSILLWLALIWNRSKIEFLRDRLNDFLNASVVDTFVEQAKAGEFESSPLWVVIPALEEEDNIAGVLSEMPKEALGRKLSVLVVDDGSRDRTGAVARENGAYVLRMPINSGQGSALKAGYHAALRMGAEAVVTLDADGQNLPSEIETLAEPVVSGAADVVIGSRVLGEFEHTALVRTVGVYAFNWLLTMLTGTKITDCASSFRVLSRRVLEAAELRQEQYQSTEILIEAARNDLTISERPITWRRRQSGTSKKGHSMKYGFLFLRTILKTWLR